MFHCLDGTPSKPPAQLPGKTPKVDNRSRPSVSAADRIAAACDECTVADMNPMDKLLLLNQNLCDVLLEEDLRPAMFLNASGAGSALADSIHSILCAFLSSEQTATIMEENVKKWAAEADVAIKYEQPHFEKPENDIVGDDASFESVASVESADASIGTDGSILSGNDVETETLDGTINASKMALEDHLLSVLGPQERYAANRYVNRNNEPRFVTHSSKYYQESSDAFDDFRRDGGEMDRSNPMHQQFASHAMDYVLYRDEGDVSWLDEDALPTQNFIGTSGPFGHTGKLDSAYESKAIYCNETAVNSFIKAQASYSKCTEVKAFFSAYIDEASNEEQDAIKNAPLPRTPEELLMCGCYDLDDKFHTIRKVGNGGFGYVFAQAFLGKPMLQVAHKKEPFTVEEFGTFKRSLVKQCAVATHGIAKVFAYFPVKVFTKKDDPKIKSPTILMGLVQELGDRTLVDEILTIYDLLDETWTAHGEGQLDDEELNKKLMFLLFKLYDHWKSLLHIVNDLDKNNVLHRDIKAVNIIFVASTLKLIDFGLARDVPTEEPGNSLTAKRGTKGYWPPHNKGHTSMNHDAYSCGIIGIDLFWGQCLEGKMAKSRLNKETLEEMFHEEWVKDFMNTDKRWKSYVEIVDAIAHAVAKLVYVSKDKRNCSVEVAEAKRIVDGLDGLFKQTRREVSFPIETID
ncbi:MAG: hypothetical protein SGILL_006997 [Bacillariaceae sp.]